LIRIIILNWLWGNSAVHSSRYCIAEQLRNLIKSKPHEIGVECAFELACIEE
jgi:hypothetical protein